MCEYCGCQALASIAQLTAEHDEVVNVIGLARKAVEAHDVVAAAGHARTIARVLGPHTAVEEGALFPALARDFPDHVERFLQDHRRIDAVLSETARSSAVHPPGEGWLERLGETLHLLRAHVLAEQDGAFPAALASLGPTDWDLVDAVRLEVGTHLRAARGQAAG